MASQANRPGSYHQDYIARIRYENSLPPPPGAPKLLDIPVEGLKYFTSPAFSSRLVRQQPLNIEADAELGMPIDLVGMPGIFDGDESSIQAPLATPPIHPKDKALLRPLSELGKPAHQTGGYSFLRRTEYISSEQKARNEATANAAKAAARSAAAARIRKPVDASKEDPIAMLRAAVKGFDIAYPEDTYAGPDSTTNIQGSTPTPAEKEAWMYPKHPTKENVQLLETYPLMPDLDAIPDSGAYMVLKFSGNPTQATEAHDARMNMAIIHPPSDSASEEKWDVFLPEDANVMKMAKRRLDVNDPDKDDEDLYTQPAKDGGSGSFKYPYLRAYEAYHRKEDPSKQYQQVALALHDNDGESELGFDVDSQDKGAYYYPITARYSMKPWRSKNLAQMGGLSQRAKDKSMNYEWMNLEIKEPDDAETNQRQNHRLEIDNES